MDDVSDPSLIFHNRNDSQRSQAPNSKSASMVSDSDLTAPPQPLRQQKSKGVYENFTKTILEYNKKRNTPISEQPHVDGRPVNLYALYGYVLKAGGSEVVEHRNLWLAISNSLGFAGHEDAIADIHRRCLREYEKEWLAKRKNILSPQVTAENPVHETAEKVLLNERPTTKTALKSEAENSVVSNLDSMVYKPLKRKFDTFAGVEPAAVTLAAKDISRLRPYPTFQELGRLDIQALSRSIQSTLPAEIGHALDVLVIIAGDRRWGLPLLHCGDLLESLVDCLLDSAKQFDRSAACSDFSTYEHALADLRRSTKRMNSAPMLVGSLRFQEHAALQRIMSVLTILRNLAFTEINQEAIASASGLMNAIADVAVIVCGTSGTLPVPLASALDFRKDLITLLSLIGQHLVVGDQGVADVLTKFILTFSPAVQEDALGVAIYHTARDPYVGPAIDALAKLISRDIPNRQLCARTLIVNSAGDSALLTSMISLAVAILPDTLEPDFLRVLPKRIPLLHHALIIAEAAANLCPSTTDQAKRWMEEHRVFSWRLINLLRTLTATSGQHAPNLEQDISIFIKRVNAILKILNDKARSSRDSPSLTRAERAIILFESGVDI